MDVTGVTYESFEELVVYCRRVAGAIGRLCLAIFGLREDAASDAGRAEQLADDLGVALQLTNILRDLREDAENGRVYLPAQDLRRFGLIDGGAGIGGQRGAAPPTCWSRSSARARTLLQMDRSPTRERSSGCRRSCASSPSARAVVRARDRAGGAARPAQRRVRAGDGRHLPAAARAHRRAPRGGGAPAHVAAGAREGVGRRARHARSGRLSAGRSSIDRRVVVVGGGLAGIAAALDCAAAGASVTLRRGQAPARRRGLLASSATACRWTTASTSSCAAASPTARCFAASAAST